MAGQLDSGQRGAQREPVPDWLGFSPLPLYWPILVATLVAYLAVTQTVKTWLLRRRWS